jgi:HEAT repeat protein
LRLSAVGRRFLPLERGLALCACAALALHGCDGSEVPEEPPPVESAVPEPVPVAVPDLEPEEAPVSPEVAGLAPRYRELHTMLESAEVLMEWKHEIVLDDLAPDPSAGATTVLILATRNDSIPVSMASLKALANRMDERVEAHFVTLLEDTSWERRAWSARILGQTGRHGTLVVLTEVLPAETDSRVRRQIEQAVAALDALAGSTEAAGAVLGAEEESGDAGG